MVAIVGPPLLRILGNFLYSTTGFSETLLDFAGNIKSTLSRYVILCFVQTLSSDRANRLTWFTGAWTHSCRRLPFLAPFARSTQGWMKQHSDQGMTRCRSMKKLELALTSVGVSWLLGWGPSDKDCCHLKMLRYPTRHRV